MATKNNPPPVQSSGTMSLPSAVIAILIAFVGGLMIGNLTAGGGNATSEEIEMAAGDRGAEGEPAAGGGAPAAGEVERFRVDVTNDMPQRGPDDALVTIAMFSDFECPFCGRVEPTIDRIIEQYGNQVRVVWRNNPLPFHQNATPAAEASLEAYAQRGDDGFWRMHGLLFENQRAISREDLNRYAGQAGLDMTRFAAALDNHTHQASITRDTQAAAQIGARGTPAFFINGRQLMGAQPFEAFQTVIDEEIRRANDMVRGGTSRAQLYATLMRGARTTPAAEPGAGAQAAQKQPQAARPQPDPNAVYNVPVGSSPVRGPNDALVTIIGFSEFQCPFCSRVRPTIDTLVERYGRDVRFVFKHNPLPFHDNAMPASEAASEAFAQRGADGFWRMHDLLFANQQALTRENLESYAQQIGLDMTRFRNALDNHTHRAAIEADQTLARNLGASGTPSFFINGRNLRGAQPVEAFTAVIDEELRKANDRVRGGTPRARVYEATIATGATAPVMLPGAAPSPQPGGEAAPDADRVYEIAVPARAPTRGAANAPVTIQIFSDFQCPFCGRVGPTIEQVMEQYNGRVKLVWRNFPLPFHQQATPAAEAAMEVFAQRGSEAFWQFHNTLFQNQRAIERADLERYAGQIAGIDMNRFRQALDNHTHQASINADMEAVRRAGAEIGTPSFFINGRLLQGAQPFPAFQAAIDRALAERGGGARPGAAAH